MRFWCLPPSNLPLSQASMIFPAVSFSVVLPPITNTLESLCARAIFAISGEVQSAALTPFMRLAAIEAPIPVPHIRIPRLHLLAETVLASLKAKTRSEEHTSELQSRPHLVCRLLLEKKKLKARTP